MSMSSAVLRHQLARKRTAPCGGEGTANTLWQLGGEVRDPGWVDLGDIEDLRRVDGGAQQLTQDVALLG